VADELELRATTVTIKKDDPNCKIGEQKESAVCGAL
jgi:hypothetical protein